MCLVSNLKMTVSDKEMSCFEMNVRFIFERKLSVDLCVIEDEVLSFCFVKIKDQIPSRFNHDVLISLWTSFVRPNGAVTPEFKIGFNLFNKLDLFITISVASNTFHLELLDLLRVSFVLTIHNDMEFSSLCVVVHPVLSSNIVSFVGCNCFISNQDPGRDVSDFDSFSNISKVMHKVN